MWKIGRHLLHRLAMVKEVKQCRELYLSDALHETVTEARAIRGMVEKEVMQRRTRYTLVKPAISMRS